MTGGMWYWDAGVRELRGTLRVCVVKWSERSGPLRRGSRVWRPGKDQTLQSAGHPLEERPEGRESLREGHAHRPGDQARLLGNSRRRILELWQQSHSIALFRNS